MEDAERNAPAHLSVPGERHHQGWKAAGEKVLGWVNPYVPEEIIYAAGMLPFQVSGNNEPVQMQGAEAYILSNSCSYIRTCWQLQLDGKYHFLDGLVSSSFCDQDKRLHSVWEYYKKLPYMDLLYAPRKRDEEAVKLYLADLEDLRSRLSRYGLRWIPAPGHRRRDPGLQPGPRAHAPALRVAQVRSPAGHRGRGPGSEQGGRAPAARADSTS